MKVRLEDEYRKISDHAIYQIKEAGFDVHAQLIAAKWDLTKTPDYVDFRKIQRQNGVMMGENGSIYPEPENPFQWPGTHWRPLVIKKVH